MDAKAVLQGVRARIKEHQLSLVAAGVAFYAMLAIFPAMISVVSIYALVSNPADIERQLKPALKSAPADVSNLVITELRNAASSSHGGMTIGLIVSLLGTLWAASGGINALLTALDQVYDAPESRKFVKQRGLALILTVGALFGAVIVVGLLAVLPAVARHAGIGGLASAGVQIGRWVLLAVLIAVMLAVLYRIGPNRPGRTHRWLSPGVLVAMVVWLLGSIAFTIYVSFFGSYNKTYGSLAAVIVLLLWLYVSAFAILVGAEVDAETLPSAPTYAADTSADQPTDRPTRSAAKSPTKRPAKTSTPDPSSAT
jgi:membrane protein